MSERVVPTKPGWWWFRWGDFIYPLELYWDDIFNDFTVRTPDSRWSTHGEPASEFSGTWLAPVPSAEDVQSAVDAMRKAAFVLEAYGDHAATLRKAIAGLTGGEG